MEYSNQGIQKNSMTEGHSKSRRLSIDPPAIRRRGSEGDTDLSTHFFLKWPVYLFIASMTAAFLVGYFVIRGLIKVFEETMESSSIRQLKKRMLTARSFRQWKQIARKLDTCSGLDGWKQTRKSKYYNSEAIEKYTRELQLARSNADPKHVLFLLQSCLSDPLTAGVLREQLYSQCWDGTKSVVEEYVQTVVMGICYLNQVVQGEPFGVPVDAHALKKDIVEFLEKCSYGRTAICLSGGGSMGQQHLGVVKALYEEGVLPSIISGTSAGAVVGAFVCCRTDAELERDFNAPYIHSISTALSSSWPSRVAKIVKTGYMFDFDKWVADIVPWTLGDLTFLDAFGKTGRTLNVSTTANGCSVNLNYITSPHVLIRSAILCSSAMPMFVKPPLLLERDPRTLEIASKDVQSFSDGSLAGDVPRGELGSLFGVRFVLTSQVNPHITPFFFNRKGEAGNPLLWRWGKQGSFRGGFILSALESFFKEQMKTLLRVMHDLEIDPAFRGMALPQAFLQNFEGDITVTSHRYFAWKVIHCMEGPSSVGEVEWWIKEGELSMWPKMSVMISRMRIERALLDLGKAASGKEINGLVTTE